MKKTFHTQFLGLFHIKSIKSILKMGSIEVIPIFFCWGPFCFSKAVHHNKCCIDGATQRCKLGKSLGSIMAVCPIRGVSHQAKLCSVCSSAWRPILCLLKSCSCIKRGIKANFARNETSWRGRDRGQGLSGQISEVEGEDFCLIPRLFRGRGETLENLWLTPTNDTKQK